MGRRILDEKVMQKLAKTLKKKPKAISELVSKEAARQGISSEAALVVLAKKNGIGTSHFQRKLDAHKNTQIRDALTARSQPQKNQIKVERSNIRRKARSGSQNSSSRSADGAPKVFIVHGHDDGMKNEVARYVENIGLKAVILHEQANKGRTIFSKFNEEASEVAFAIVLITPDDAGKDAKAVSRRRVWIRRCLPSEEGRDCFMVG